MHTIVLATQKGGSGKSTLSIGLAVAAQRAGHTVRLIETDKQGTLSNWQVRRGLAEPIVEPIYNALDIERRLQALARGGVSLTIIDTASGINAATTAAIRHCDLCLIPSRPSVADIEATAATLSVARAWRRPFAFILNQTPIRAGHRTSGATAALDESAPRDIAEVLARPFIVMRNDHQDALAAGLSVVEFAPQGKSAEEVRSLWQWVEAHLTGGLVAAVEQEAAATDFAEVEFPILLSRAKRQTTTETPASHPLSTWAEAKLDLELDSKPDAGLAWDSGL